MTNTISVKMMKKPIVLFLLTVIVLVGTSLSSPNALLVASQTNGTFRGAEFCGNCHVDTYEGWDETAHAHAVMLIQNASGNFYSIGATSNLAGTPSRIYDEDTFRARCRNCHVTGGNDFDPLGIDQVWPEMDTDPAKFLNVQCEVCHGAYEPHDSANPTMAVDYSSALCEQCHTGSHDFSHSQSAHAQSLLDLLDSGHPRDSCLHCMSTQGFIGLSVTLDTIDLEGISCVACHDPHVHEYESQLRYEDATSLCTQCHTGSHHPQGEFFEDSPHLRAGLECTSCHGQGTHFAHGHESSVINHTWGIYGMYYPYNQTVSEEPIVCSTCHTQDWATLQLGVIQSLTTDLIDTITPLIEEAKAAIIIANETTGIDVTKINLANEKVEEAESALHYVEYDASGGLHNPEETYRLLSDAAIRVGESKSIALEALSEAETSNLEAQVSSAQNMAMGGIIGALIAGLVIGIVVQRFRK